MPTADEAIAELLASPPEFHGPGRRWALSPATNAWLIEHVQPSWRTVETGCGHSSALLALKGAEHTIVAPDPAQHEAVRAWCAARGRSTDRVTSVVALSQDALPSLEGGPFDLALIDGGHAFPTPFIDWYYLAVRLRLGGFLIIDDMSIRAPGMLRKFLAQEKGRWALEADLGRAVIFRKLADPVIPADDWVSQPWSNPPVARARHAVQLRTRLRALLGRG